MARGLVRQAIRAWRSHSLRTGFPCQQNAQECGTGRAPTGIQHGRDAEARTSCVHNRCARNGCGCRLGARPLAQDAAARLRRRPGGTAWRPRHSQLPHGRRGQPACGRGGPGDPARGRQRRRCRRCRPTGPEPGRAAVLRDRRRRVRPALGRGRQAARELRRPRDGAGRRHRATGFSSTASRASSTMRCSAA